MLGAAPARQYFNEHRTPAGFRRPPAAFWRTWVADKFCLVSLAEALSRAVPDTDCRVILRIPHAQAWEQLHLRRPDTRAGGIAFPFLSGRSVRKRYGCFTHVQRGISVEDH